MNPNALMDIADPAALVAQCWQQHAEQPDQVVQALSARASVLAADAAAADAIGLAEHVWLSHLQDEAGLARFLATLALPSGAPEAARQALQRAHWVLGQLAGQPDETLPGLPLALRWRALQNVWNPLALRGHSAQVQAALAQAVGQAAASDDTAASRGLAATCNNLAVELRCGRRGRPELDGLMLALATHSRSLWGRVGTWLHAERAEYQLARCQAVLGQGAAALRHARAALALIDDHADDPQADALERCFAQEALAWAQLAAGETAAAGQTLARMASHLAAIEDPESRDWAAEALAALQAACPGAARSGAGPATAPGWVIRPAQAADLDALTPLFDAYRQFYAQPADAATARHFLAERLARQESVVLLAIEPRDAAGGTAAGPAPGGRVLGFCQLYPSHCSVEAQPIYWLYDLFVLPQARRAGIGRQLLQAAEALARQEGKARLDLSTARSNLAAQAAYAALGWVRDEQFFTYSRRIAS